MSYQIKNLSNRTVSIRCNSGETRHIPPRAVSSEIPEVELNNNLTVEKLKSRCVIALQEVEKKAGIKKEKAEKGKADA
jgi:hypothetical protein